MAYLYSFFNYISYNVVHPLDCNIVIFENAAGLKNPFPLKLTVPLIVELDTKLDAILSIANENKLQLYEDKYKTPTGIVGKELIGQLLNEI